MSESPSPEIYSSPLAQRFASREMLENFSELKKFRTWRKVWVALAEAEHELGVKAVTAKQIRELRAHQDDINLDVAREFEAKLRHDVMAHIHAFGKQCPNAAKIIHLGATSCDITDNADIIIMRDGLLILRRKLVNLIDRLGTFAEKYKDLPTLGWTHFQPAQLTTVGKRACLWAQDFLLDLNEIESRLETLQLRGIKGATGTQMSFLELFADEPEKVELLEQLVVKKLGFETKPFAVTGQTYPRKLDALILNAVCGIAQSAHKFANDIRLLQHLREVEEPFEAESQVGSSAMAYKRNPMRCERITGLARFLICLEPNAALNAAEQWLERTLDDSSNRRLSLSEAFLTADAILHIAINVASGLVVRPEMIKRNTDREIPFMVTELIIMIGVKAGADRQELHELIRKHSVATAEAIRSGAEKNDLLERLAGDPLLLKSRENIRSIAINSAVFTGLAGPQVSSFLNEHVAPIRKRYARDLDRKKADLRV
ncbi:MAG: adenylosuccinate lyase [Candidatus Brocadiia bacterium]|jgi:adenylosuccinate lyase